VPHAAIEGLEEPMLALGLSPDGIDFDAPDGKPATIVFLLLLAPGRLDEEVRVLASIARSVIASQARTELMDARETEQALKVLAESAQRIAEERRARGPALADI